jgi:hypothetical protein
VKTLAAAAALGTLLAVSALPGAPSYAVETCHGSSATVVPDAEGNLVGTSGADVIVAHGGQRVDAGDGDDLVCLVADDLGVEADAGPGDDTVDATRSSDFSVVSLGAGQDSFLGTGPGEDWVWGAAPEGLGDDGLNPLDTERDDIKTGDGDDRVFSGSLGAVNLDSIGTGRGDDRVQLVGLDHAVSLDVGAGRNTAIVTLAAAETTAWLFDATKRTINVDETTSRWKGRLDRWYFRMAEGQARSSLVFLGSRASESVFVSGPGLVPHLRLGGGADWGGSLTTKGGTFFLGDGRDRLTLGKYDSVAQTFPFPELTLKLQRHRAAFGGGIVSPVFGVETLRAGATQVDILGSSRADRITANGCRVLVRGGPGADVLTRGQDVLSICDAVVTRLEGGAGNDWLVGANRTDDVLLGGVGFDHAIGMGGTDTCRAEVRKGCERS